MVIKHVIKHVLSCTIIIAKSGQGKGMLPFSNVVENFVIFSNLEILYLHVLFFVKPKFSFSF